MRRLFSLLFISLLVTACSSGGPEEDSSPNATVEIPGHLQEVDNLKVIPRNPEPRYKIDLVRELSYGDKYDDVVYLGYISDFAVDNRGRVFLADAINDKIHVYRPDGSYLQSIGRSGRGPGEFQTVRRQLIIDTDDEYLHAYDDTNFRISRFSLETLELAGTVNLDMGKWNHIEDLKASRPFRFYSRSDGRYVVRFRVYDRTIDENTGRPRIETGFQERGRSQFYVFNAEFEPESDLLYEFDHSGSLVQKAGSSYRLYTFPFSNKTLTDISRSGHLYTACSDEFLIRILQPDGSPGRVIYHPMTGAVFNGEDQEAIEEANDFFVRGFPDIDLPDRWPVLDQLKVDDEGRLWISTITESFEKNEWWVLDENGRFMGQFSWPRKLLDQPGEDARNYIIRNGAVYYLSTESMNLDEQTVIKYRVEMTPVEGAG